MGKQAPSKKKMVCSLLDVVSGPLGKETVLSSSNIDKPPSRTHYVSKGLVIGAGGCQAQATPDQPRRPSQGVRVLVGGQDQ